MSVKIYLSWPNNLPSATNRDLIREAIQLASDKIGADAEVLIAPRISDASPRATGDLATSAFNEIRNSDVFVADISLAPDVSPSAPNPNVLIELGYALGALGTDRVLTVMNTAFGSPKELPIGLRNQRIISYALSPREHEGRESAEQTAAESFGKALDATFARNPAKGRGLQRALDSSATKERREFEQRIREGSFYRMPKTNGALALSLIPGEDLASEIDFAAPEMSRLFFAPIYAAGWEIAHRGHAMLAIAKPDRNSLPSSVTELNSRGRIFAADLLLLNSSKYFDRIVPPLPPGVVGTVPSIAYELEVMKATHSYLNLMRSLNIRGPVKVGLSLLGVRNYAFAARTLRGGEHLFEDDDVVAGFVTFDSPDQWANPEAVARHLRPAFDFIWREFGFVRSQNFDATGNWRGQYQ